MNILYISSVPSKKQLDYMKSNLKSTTKATKYGMIESGFKFHHLIMNGIVNDTNNFIYSLVGRPTSKKTHNNIIWKKNRETNKNISYEHIGYLNIPVIKNIMISFSYLFKTIKWIRKNKKNEKCIIIDASYVTVMPFINLATKIAKCKKVAIVCDIYEYMADVKDAREKSSKKHKIVAKFMKSQYKQIDGFVFLTEAMNDVLNKKKKPYIVMEGLVDYNMKTISNEFNNKLDKDIVMYAGGLRAQYGLKNLVEGFMDYKNKNSELWIFGAGNYAREIEKKAKKDKRIKYFGMVENAEILKKEALATILVNPRPANQEFTKYSFPSKNMEYMASGTPVLTTKLPGMPKEYYDYIYLIDGNTKKDITKSLEKVFRIEKKVLHSKGLEAKKFVLEYKNNIMQASRILNLCETVMNNESN